MSWDDPATPEQLSTIARLSKLAGIESPTEEYPMTKWQAREEIYQLLQLLRNKKKERR